MGSLTLGLFGSAFYTLIVVDRHARHKCDGQNDSLKCAIYVDLLTRFEILQINCGQFLLASPLVCAPSSLILLGRGHQPHCPCIAMSQMSPVSLATIHQSSTRLHRLTLRVVVQRSVDVAYAQRLHRIQQEYRTWKRTVRMLAQVAQVLLSLQVYTYLKVRVRRI